MTNWHVGMRVKCVKPDDWFDRLSGEKAIEPSLPSYGQELTIREVEIEDDEAYLRFDEIINPVRMYVFRVMECRFHSKHFTPIVTTNIDIFEAMLAPAPKAKVRA